MIDPSPNTLTTILTSAAVGVLVSGIVTLIGQGIERRARREELLLREALGLAKLKREVTLLAAKASSVSAILTDDVIVAETYFRWLKILMETGKLPAEADKARGETEV